MPDPATPDPNAAPAAIPDPNAMPAAPATPDPNAATPDPNAAPVPDPNALPIAPAPAAAPIIEASATPATLDPNAAPEPVKEIPQADFISSASTILTDAGLDPNTVIEKINANGGEIPLELYNELVTKTSKGQADVLVSGFNVEVANKTTAQEAENKKIYETVGGETEWNRIKAWTETEEAGLSKEAAAEYTTMLQAGGVQAQLAANALKEAFMASPGFSAAPDLEKGDTTPPAGGLELISRQAYLTDKKKAIRENDGVTNKLLDQRAEHTMKSNPELWRGINIQG